MGQSKATGAPRTKALPRSRRQNGAAGDKTRPRERKRGQSENFGGTNEPAFGISRCNPTGDHRPQQPNQSSLGQPGARRSAFQDTILQDTKVIKSHCGVAAKSNRGFAFAYVQRAPSDDHKGSPVLGKMSNAFANPFPILFIFVDYQMLLLFVY